jgi:hypothetical protein
MGQGAVEWAIARGGDWIDTNSAMAIGEREAKMTALKENPDFDILNPKGREQESLSIFFRNFAAYVAKTIAFKIKNEPSLPTFPKPISVVLAGGTSMAKGFETVMGDAIKKINLPFDIKEVRSASDRMYAVAKGCLMMGLADSE